MQNGGQTGSWDFDGWETFTRKLFEDSWALDQGVFEVAVDRIGRPTHFDVFDGSTFYLADHKHISKQDQKSLEAYMINGYLPRYTQVFNNVVQREYYPWELCLGIRNATSSVKLNGYGLSESEVLIQIITWMLNSNQYNGNFFQQGSNPKGLLYFKGNVDPIKLDSFKQNWSNTLSGVRNCVSGNTYIYTDKGCIQISELFESSNEDKRLRVWNGESFNSANVYKSDIKRLNRMYLNNGTNIESSPDHRFKVIGESGLPEWRRREDIKLGDFVLVNKNTVSLNPDSLTYKGKKVESDLFEIMGWFIGDGWMGDYVPKRRRLSLYYHYEKEYSLSKKHLEILHKYDINASLKRDYYPDKQKILDKYGFKSVNDYKLSISVIDNHFHKFLYDNGFIPSSLGKEIPKFMFNENSYNKCSFLKGFFSADGNNSTGRAVQITIVNDLLREQTKLLLLSEGIHCCNHEGNERVHSFGKSKGGYRLLIKDLELYFNKVGFIQEHKQISNLKKRKPYIKESVDRNTAVYILNQVKDKEYSIKKNTGEWTLSKRERDDLNRFIRNTGRSMTRQLVEYYTNKLNVELPDFFINYNFEKVIDLEDVGINIPMYDVEMFDNKHQFIANGMLTHNSHKLAAMSGGEGVEWINMQLNNKDMEFHKWTEFLTVIACTVFRIDPDEVGFHLEGSKGMFGQDGQKERIKHSKEKGLEPFMKFWARKFTKYLISPLTGGKYEFVFNGLEPDDEEAQLDRDIKILTNGGMSVQDFFMKYSERDLDMNKDILLNQIMLQYRQLAQVGDPESNAAVDEEAGEGNEEPENIFNEFDDKSENSDPFSKALNKYVDKFVKENSR